MVSEDPETYDIHGDLMGGWPPVVNPVLQVRTETLTKRQQITQSCSQPIRLLLSIQTTNPRE
jgi:hypothetical protein